MVEIRAEFDNLDEVQAALRKYGRDAEEAIGKAVQAQALDVRGVIQKKIQRGPKTGTTYYRIPGEKYMTIRAGGTSGPPVAFIPGGGNKNLSPRHTASAPDEAPASDTGRLARSIAFRRINSLTAEISSDAPYAAMLEFGTARMDARPAWTPAVEEKRPDFVRRVTNAIERLTRQAN